MIDSIDRVPTNIIPAQPPHLHKVAPIIDDRRLAAARPSVLLVSDLSRGCRCGCRSRSWRGLGDLLACTRGPQLNNTSTAIALSFCISLRPSLMHRRTYQCPRQDLLLAIRQCFVVIVRTCEALHPGHPSSQPCSHSPLLVAHAVLPLL